MMETLKPCPFCGGEAKLCVHEPTGVSWVRCIECETSGSASNAFCTVKAWNRRAERTCKWKVKHYGPMFTVFECSVCGFKRYEPLAIRGYAELEPNYCPNCGARVVEE